MSTAVSRYRAIISFDILFLDSTDPPSRHLYVIYEQAGRVLGECVGCAERNRWKCPGGMYNKIISLLYSPQIFLNDVSETVLSYRTPNDGTSDTTQNGSWCRTPCDLTVFHPYRLEPWQKINDSCIGLTYCTDDQTLQHRFRVRRIKEIFEGVHWRWTCKTTGRAWACLSCVNDQKQNRHRLW